MSNNTENLKKCYMALEDNHSLIKLRTASPKTQKEGLGKHTYFDDKGDVSNHIPSIQAITQLKESGKTAQAALMAYQLANIEASRKGPPSRIKKLYILSGHLYTQCSVEGGRSREAARSYRAGSAQHWLRMAAARPPRPDAALRAAARLAAVAHLLHDAQRFQVWCTVASIAIQARAFDLCSKAFIKLEAMDSEIFEKLAIEVFSTCKPKDAKGNKVECPHCHVAMPDWAAKCTGCGTETLACAVSARPLGAQAPWRCSVCDARALQHELVLRHSCPMCHTPLH